LRTEKGIGEGEDLKGDEHGWGVAAVEKKFGEQFGLCSFSFSYSAIKRLWVNQIRDLLYAF